MGPTGDRAGGPGVANWCCRVCKWMVLLWLDNQKHFQFFSLFFFFFFFAAQNNHDVKGKQPCQETSFSHSPCLPACPPVRLSACPPCKLNVNSSCACPMDPRHMTSCVSCTEEFMNFQIFQRAVDVNELRPQQLVILDDQPQLVSHGHCGRTH